MKLLNMDERGTTRGERDGTFDIDHHVTCLELLFVLTNYVINNSYADYNSNEAMYGFLVD